MKDRDIRDVLEDHRDHLIELDLRIEALETLAANSKSHWSFAGIFAQLRAEFNDHLRNHPAATHAADVFKWPAAGALDEGPGRQG